ncbi:restriction endonuclease [Brevundimonas sp.]|uniref:restriction endonuclease n=1 Tax=Brevundimonas sp. TaxID=1871086 RepID=UPI003BA988F5
MSRLPSFNDFSPGLIGDVRAPLKTIKRLAPDWTAIVRSWANDYFGGSIDNKRASTNVPATLTSLGLFDRKTMSLTQAGETIAAAASPQEAAQALAAHVVSTGNGILLIEAVRALNLKAEKVSKDSLKGELTLLGVELSAATTDHTTLLNWMVQAGLFEDRRQNFRPNDEVLKSVLGISASERGELTSLPLDQSIFLQILRRLSEVEPAGSPTKVITDECLADHSAHFDEDQLSRKVIRPLAEAGWIESTQRSGGRGAKSGWVQATPKLMDLPIDAVTPDFNQVIPADLRGKISLPRSEIKRLLVSESANDRGLGLELLALRMMIDLGLQPRSFRQRSKDTAYAEVDLTAEGRRLLFSRWQVQCKCVKSRVSLGDVAKEVGLAIFSKSHVVAVVTTSDFSREAKAYARQVTADTHLQFVLLNGEAVNGYLDGGAAALQAFVAENASQVMVQKRGQPITPSDD